MKRLLVMLCMATTMASAQSRTCDLKESEQQVRQVIQRVMDLRSQQDDRFLSFYASDEYSFPGESWVFQRQERAAERDRKSTRLNSSHVAISYAVFCLKKKIGAPFLRHACITLTLAP